MITIRNTRLIAPQLCQRPQETASSSYTVKFRATERTRSGVRSPENLHTLLRRAAGARAKLKRPTSLVVTQDQQPTRQTHMTEKV
jgi:hypothetical protein